MTQILRSHLELQEGGGGARGVNELVGEEEEHPLLVALLRQLLEPAFSNELAR